MQVVVFAKRRFLRPYWVAGSPEYPGFMVVRIGRIELRFGRGRMDSPWGRPPNPWAYEHG
jgi:hypothetical protein